MQNNFDLMMKMQDERRLLWTKSTSGADFRSNHPITVEMLLPGTTWRTDQWINLSLPPAFGGDQVVQSDVIFRKAEQPFHANHSSTK